MEAERTAPTWVEFEDFPLELFGEIASHSDGVGLSMLAVCSKALYNRLGSEIFLVDEILEISAEQGYVEVLKLILGEVQPAATTKSLFSAFVDYFFPSPQKGIKPIFQSFLFAKALFGCQDSVLEFLTLKYGEGPLKFLPDFDYARGAARQGRYDILKRYDKFFPTNGYNTHSSYNFFVAACEEGQIDKIPQEILSNYMQPDYYFSSLSIVARNFGRKGDFEGFKALSKCKTADDLRKRNHVGWIDFFVDSLKGGNIPLIELIYQAFGRLPESHGFPFAPNLEVIEWIVSVGGSPSNFSSPPIGPYIVPEFQKRDNLEAIKAYYNMGGYVEYDPNSVRSIATLQWFLEDPKRQGITRPVQTIQSYYRIRPSDYLDPAEPTNIVTVMKNAIVSGNVPLLDFAYSIRKYPDPSLAPPYQKHEAPTIVTPEQVTSMTLMAAFHGKISVYKWFVDQGLANFAVLELEGAMSRSRLAMLQYFIDQRPELMDDFPTLCASNDYIKLFRWAIHRGFVTSRFRQRYSITPEAVVSIALARKIMAGLKEEWQVRRAIADNDMM